MINNGVRKFFKRLKHPFENSIFLPYFMFFRCLINIKRKTEVLHHCKNSYYYYKMYFNSNKRNKQIKSLLLKMCVSTLLLSFEKEKWKFRFSSRRRCHQHRHLIFLSDMYLVKRKYRKIFLT